MPFQCEHCLKRFPTDAKLAAHTKNKTKACPRLKCPSCDERFCSFKKLNDHKVTHAQNDDIIDDQQVPSPESSRVTVTMDISDKMVLTVDDNELENMLLGCDLEFYDLSI